MSLNKNKKRNYLYLAELSALVEFFCCMFGRGFIIASSFYLIIYMFSAKPYYTLDYAFKILGYGFVLIMVENILREKVVCYFYKKHKMYIWIENFNK